MLAECLTLALLAAADPDRGKPPDPPSLELLEFLGDFQTPDGRWLDPTELDDDRDPQDRPTAPARDGQGADS